MKSFILTNILIPFITKFIKELLSGENYKKWIDKLFDFIEDVVVDSETEFDDKLVLPIIDQLRVLLDVPDED